MKGRWLGILLPFIVWWAFPLSLSHLPAWQLALCARASLPVASCIPTEKPNTPLLKERFNNLVGQKGRGRQCKWEKQGRCLLFLFGIEMRMRTPLLNLDGNKKHFLIVSRELHSLWGSFRKRKHCWCEKLEIQSVTFSRYQVLLLYSRSL